ncbi:DNA-formamidopyrimidine glycosylase [soil metagenome]
MPELPEATVISQDIRVLAGGKKVTRAAVFRPDVTNVEMEQFGERLVGRTLLGTGRRGKIISLDFGDVVGVIHLVISGRVLRLDEWQEPDHMNTAILEFAEGPVLAFTRLWLGYFNLYEPDDVESHPLISRLGPDPFSKEFTLDYLSRVFSRKANVKSLLLDQSVVAGLGNIYVDEVLFAAEVHPTRRADTLTSEETDKIFTAIRDILRRAILLRGTTFNSYHDAFGETGKFQHQLQVFTREGDSCPCCGTMISKLKVAGRGTHVCPTCQPLPV